MAFGEPEIDFTAATQLSPTATLSLVLLVNLVLVGAIAYAIVRRKEARSQGRAATLSVTLDVPPHLGSAVLRGVVETEDPSRPAITITVVEGGTEAQDKNGRWSHAWKEISRDVKVEPFYLVLASGTRVRVEPDDTVLLADTLDVTSRGNPRERQARLEKGEIAYVAGILTHGWDPGADPRQAGLYRGALATGHLMRRGAERLLVSTEPLARRYTRRAAAHTRMAIILCAALMIMNGAIFGTTLAVSALGENVDAAVVDTRTELTRNKGSTTIHFLVRAKYHDPANGLDVVVEDEVNSNVFARIKAGQFTRVPFRVVRMDPRLNNIGYGATIGPLRAIFAPLLVAGLLVAYFFTVRASYDWYERRKTVESGSGPLEL